ncbi:hypothetical protein Asp14428_31410 [Actinoplanes sp. NBRC 14428]|uniref:Uncharacterized protein n=1 Tax=Pseudosporangium ferrugineum TaxID=439699 RepID=A0A2T0RFY5_9ACTN|nr:hypothetical protein CLV70_12658 [Pseudosporangium ferrugineum]BCJ51666.1 hypothetical protein Asp14428_31410 [Actinoplanes sp. NBRC 14428]
MVIATVFLSIIGMSAGFALGTRHESPGPGPGADTPVVPVTTEPTGNPGIRCPEEMHETALRLGITAPLTQVMRVRADETGTTVWICEDPGGKLYYQANRGGQSAKWIEGETALFLADVVREGDTFRATAFDGNTFEVNRSKLRVTIKGNRTTYDVRPEE